MSRFVLFVLVAIIATACRPDSASLPAGVTHACPSEATLHVDNRKTSADKDVVLAVCKDAQGRNHGLYAFYDPEVVEGVSSWLLSAKFEHGAVECVIVTLPAQNNTLKASCQFLRSPLQYMHYVHHG